MLRARGVNRIAAWAVPVTLALTLAAKPAVAQRFEGIISFKVSNPAAGRQGTPGRGGVAAGADGSRPGAVAGRAGAGRGTADAPVGAGRGNAGRGNAGRGAEVRTGTGRGDSPVSDAQVEAMRTAFSGNLQNIEYMTRRGRVRIGIASAPGGVSPAAMIYAPEDGVMFTLLPMASLYSETALDDIRALASEQASSVDASVAARPPVITHTKQFELIANHRCEHVLIEIARQKTDVCMGKGLGVFVMPAMMGNAAGLSRAMADANGFPLKVVQANGVVTMEVTRIERKALPESLFNVPDSYTRMPDILRRPPE